MASILRISEAATMAIHAVAFLANGEEGPRPTKSIANTLVCSQAHLSKVLQRLTKVGLLSATRGPRGGFVLAKHGSAITMLEVYEAIDGQLTSTACMFETQICNGHDCLVGTLIQSINDQVRKYFENTLMDGLDCSKWYKSMVKQGLIKT